jgi:sarcosine oxidase subunit beta
MPETVDVAVIGGGVIGLSVARELRLAGVDRVLVLEREASVGQGSSSRANGGVRAQFTTRANIAFSAWSIAELERLDAQAMARTGHHQTLGEMTVAEIIDRFAVAHLEEHADQLEAGRRAGNG